jgi:hypothetical protein
MGRVYITLKGLNPVAVTHGCPHGLLRIFIKHVRLNVGQGWELSASAHVCPYDTVALLARVRLNLHLVLEVAFGGLRRHIDAITVHVELPTVVYAPQAAFLVTTEEQAGPTVWAVVVDEAYVAIGVAESN